MAYSHLNYKTVPYRGVSHDEGIYVTQLKQRTYTTRSKEYILNQQF